MTEKSRIFHTKDRCEKTWKLLQICAKMVYTEYSEAILLKKTLLHWFHGKIQTVLQKFCETKIRQFLYCTLWKLRKFNPTEKIFRQNTYLVISLVKLLLSRNFCQKCAGVNSRNFHTVCCENEKFSLTEEKNREINSLVCNFFYLV